MANSNPANAPSIASFAGPSTISQVIGAPKALAGVITQINNVEKKKIDKSRNRNDMRNAQIS